MKKKLIVGFAVVLILILVICCTAEPEITTYIVTFNENGGTLTSSETQKIIEGDKVIKPSEPIYEDFSFTGWYTDSKCKTLYDFRKSVTNSFTLYAGWKSDPKYFTVTFDANGGVLNTSITQIVSKGEQVDFPLNPYREGFSFLGWYTERECLNLYDFNKPIEKDFVLYAKWNVITHKVTFEANGGILTDGHYQIIEKGNRLIKPNNPTFDGFTFIGWYIDIECTNRYDFEKSITEDFILYAKWGSMDEYISSIFDDFKIKTYDIVLECEITEECFILLCEKIKQSLNNINLDLSKTTGLISIPDNSFKDATRLISISLPEGVTTIGSSVFSGCSELINVEIPNTVTSIGNSSFYECNNLTKIEIPQYVTSISHHLFYGCSNLETITMPDTIISIDWNSFAYCSNLKNIIIPNKVKELDTGAFYGCSSLTSIVIPTSVEQISKDVFRGCKNLSSVTFENTYNWYKTKETSLTNGSNIKFNDPSSNASYLVNTGADYYFYKKNVY